MSFTLRIYIPQGTAINLLAGDVEVTASWLCLVFKPVTPRIKLMIDHHIKEPADTGSLADTQSNENGSQLWVYRVVKATGDGPDEDSSVRVLRKSTQLGLAFQVAKICRGLCS